MVSEPRWRTFLCWGAVILYLTLPLFVFGIRITEDFFPEVHWGQTLSEARFLETYFQTLTAFVFGLAGLNTWDRKLNGKPHQPAEPAKPTGKNT